LHHASIFRIGFYFDSLVQYRPFGSPQFGEDDQRLRICRQPRFNRRYGVTTHDLPGRAALLSALARSAAGGEIRRIQKINPRSERLARIFHRRHPRWRAQARSATVSCEDRRALVTVAL
jgi:hypothetical protein